MMDMEVTLADRIGNILGTPVPGPLFFSFPEFWSSDTISCLVLFFSILPFLLPSRIFDLFLISPGLVLIQAYKVKTPCMAAIGAPAKK